MFKHRLLNIWLIANLGLTWLIPQPSLAFNLFGPSDAEKQILFLQGYNTGIARTLSSEDNLGLPTNTKTGVKTTTAVNASSTLVTNPLSANLDVGNFHIMSNTGNRKIVLDSNVDLNQWSLSNGSVHLYSATTGDNPLSVGAFGNRAVALRAAATSTDAYAGMFTGNVDIDYGMLTINNPFHYSVATPPVASTGLGVSGATFGIVGLSYGSNPDSVGILGGGVNGVKGEARYGNGKAIWGVTWPGEYPDSYAGYFDGRVKILTDQENTLEVTGNGNVIRAWSTRPEGGAALFGSGHTGVLGVANYPGGIGVYGQAYAGEYAGKFDGEVNIMGGNLRFTSNLNPRIDINTNVASTLGINFNYNSNTGRPDDWGLDSLSDFVFTSNNRLGIGTTNPNSNLHIKTASGNAELDIQSANNTHWGIYQASTGGALNFWHGDNRLTINDKGISTKGICLSDVCISRWEDLKAILNVSPTPTKPGVVPNQQ